MRNIWRYIPTSMLLLALAGCTIDESYQSAVTEEKQLTIRAIREDGDTPETRTVRNDKGKVYWSKGDQISLFYGHGSNGGSVFTSNQTADTVKVTNFTGTITAITGGGEISADETYFWGLYPYNEAASCDGTSITTTLSSHQDAYPGSYANGTNISVGRSQGLIMGFYNACGGFRFSLNKEGVKKVTFRGNKGENLVGKLKISFVNGKVNTEILEGENEIVLEAPAGEYFEPEQLYYFVMAPTPLESGFSVKAETFTEEATFTYESSIVIEASNFKSKKLMDTGLTWIRKTGNIPVEDANFKAYLVNNFDTNGDGEISYEEAEAVETIKITSSDFDIKSLGGIEAFSNLDTLVVDNRPYLMRSYYYIAEDGTVEEVVEQMREYSKERSKGGLTKTPDLSGNPRLRYLALRGQSSLPSLGVSKNTELTYLDLTCSLPSGDYSLDLSENTNLRILNLNYCCQTGILDISNLENLECFYSVTNAFSQVIVGNHDKLKTISLGDFALSSLDLSGCPNINYIRCLSASSLESLELHDNAKSELQTFEISHCKICDLDFSGFSSLKTFDCTYNDNLKSIDLSDCPALQTVNAYCNYNCSEFKLGQHPDLKTLYLAQCHALTSLDLTGCPALEWISTWSCENLGSIDFTNCAKLKTMYLPPFGSKFSTCEDMEEYTVSLNDGEENSDQRLVFLPYFPNLKTLSAWHFTTIDLSGNVLVEALTVGTTICSAIDLSPLKNLKSLTIGGWSSFETIDISNNLSLENVTFEASEALKTLYVAEGQNIEGITVNRSDEKIHPDTQIVIKPEDGGGQGNTDDEL